MTGLGTVINSAGIIAGGLVGHFTGKLFKEEQQEALNKACGISVLFIAIAGAMEGMLRIEGDTITSGKSMLVVLCLAAGTVIGELAGIENGFERFGEGLKHKTGNSGDSGFVNAFVTSSLTVCIGAMAIVGAIQDGMLNDYSTLMVKTVLDFIIIAVMTKTAVSYLSLIGSVLIFCVGVNLVWGKKVRVANMLPAVVLAILAAYLPWHF